MQQGKTNCIFLKMEKPQVAWADPLGLYFLALLFSEVL